MRNPKKPFADNHPRAGLVFPSFDVDTTETDSANADHQYNCWSRLCKGLFIANYALEKPWPDLEFGVLYFPPGTKGQ